MNSHSQTPSPPQDYNSNLQNFQIRLTARLCVILISLTQIITRSLVIFNEAELTDSSRLWYVISLPFLIIVSLIVGIEYILSRKIGPRIVKYSKTVDLILLFFFTLEWMFTSTAGLTRLDVTDPPSFGVSALFSFTNFGWRTLLMTIIVQKWQLKIIPPLLATSLTIGYSIYYDSNHVLNLLLRGLFQIVYVAILMYFEDKMKWKMMLINMQQEKWVQINDFILNNVPENIMILDFEGNAKFVSDYCKSFLESCSLSSDTQEFFSRIRDLNQQFTTEQTSPFSDDLEPMKTFGNFINIPTEQNLTTPREKENLQILQDLLKNLKRIIQDGLLKERQFLIYNGKLKVENQQDKSLELKLSHIKQFDREYIVLIIRDTTQRDLLVTLADNNKYKDQLLASVSHELRAPLNGNINLVESAINSPKVPDQIKETLLTPALRSSKFLLHLINDILDMSQIKEKKLRLTFQSGNLQDTIKSTAQLIELQAQKKGIELQIELHPELPQLFCTDHIRVSQIVLNLLHNAIKFTQLGMVKLIAAPVEGNPSWVKITVEDSGIGMSPRSLQKLFSNYTHIEFEGRTQINPTGVGLGLNIAHNLAEFLAPKGQEGIDVESALNKGSCFSFILENKRPVVEGLDNSCEVPDEIPESKRPILLSKFSQCLVVSSSLFQARTQSESIPLLKECSCAKVLVVDDNAFNTMAFETILSSLQVKCDTVYNGNAAVKKLLNRQEKVCGKECQQYSVVFMDQEMPEMSGIETVQEIRRLQKEKFLVENFKVIGCTAHKAKEEVEKFLKSGIEKCIHKPISTTMIKDILDDIL